MGPDLLTCLFPRSTWQVEKLNPHLRWPKSGVCSVDRLSVLWRWRSPGCGLDKFVPLFPSKNADGRSRLRVEGDRAVEFSELSFFIEVVFCYQFLIIIAIEMILHVAGSSISIDICSDGNLSDLDYAYKFTVRSEDSSNLEIFHDSLNDSIGITTIVLHHRCPSSLVHSFTFTTLNSDRSHCNRPSVARISWGLPIILVHTRGLGSYFGSS